MTMNEFWDFVRAAEREYAAYRKRIMTQFALSAAETDIVMFLANNPGYDTAAQIARVRKIPKSQVSLAVNALLEKGLLRGLYRAGDKKSLHLSLTAVAGPVVRYGRAQQAAFGEELFSNFTEEEKVEFARLHQKIAKNIAHKGE